MWVNNVLVLLGATYQVQDVAEVLLREAVNMSSTFTLVLPGRPATGRADDTAQLLRDGLRDAGYSGAAQQIRHGDADPVIAAVENFDPWLIDKIIICFQPTRFEQRCGVDAAARVRRLTGADVAYAHPGANPRIRRSMLAAA